MQTMTPEQKLTKIFATLGHVERIQNELESRNAVMQNVKLPKTAKEAAFNTKGALAELNRELAYIKEVLNS